MAEFTPRIIAFLCNWCSYAGADLAGVSRIRYAPNIRVIRVMCSGRVDPVFVAKSFLRGVDGVMVLGCHFGDCHYINGNYNAEKRITAMRKLLSYTPVKETRLYLDWVSAAEGERFANLVNDFVQKITALGPISLDRDTEDALKAVMDVLSDEVFRHITGVEWQVTEKSNVYGERIQSDKYVRGRDAIIYREYLRHRIVRLLDGQILSIPVIAKTLTTAPDTIFEEICALQEKGSVCLADIKDEYARYTLNR